VLVLAPIVPIVIQSFSSKPLYDDTGTWTLADYADPAPRQVGAADHDGEPHAHRLRDQGRGGAEQQRVSRRSPTASSRCWCWPRSSRS
jgi:hypothetical protein